MHDGWGGAWTRLAGLEPAHDVRADVVGDLAAGRVLPVLRAGGTVPPHAPLLSLTTLFVACMLIDGTLAIHSAVRAGDRRERWGGLAAGGGINLVARPWG